MIHINETDIRIETNISTYISSNDCSMVFPQTSVCSGHGTCISGKCYCDKGKVLSTL